MSRRRIIDRAVRLSLDALEARRLLSGDDHSDHPFCGVDHLVGPEYQATSRWTSTATNPSTGSAGTPITLTYGFIADGVQMPSGVGEPAAPSNLLARLNTKYGSQAVWQPLFQSVFDFWSSVSGITYVFEPNDDGEPFLSTSGQLGVRADLRIGGKNIDGGSGTLAYNFFPSNGDMTIDTSEITSGFMVSTVNNSRALRNVVSHEHGHGMGLLHVGPLDNSKLMEALASTVFDGPQFDDVLGAQSLYGDALEKPGRNETAATATDLGSLVNGTNLTLASGVSICNTNDRDTFRLLAAADKSISISVTPNGPTYLQGPQGSGGTTFNAAAQGNLSLAVLAADGTTVLATANVNGVGAGESLTNVVVPAGASFIRVSATSGSTQMYTLKADFVNDASAPAAPSAPDLPTVEDFGPSNTDNVTNDNTPTFNGTAVAGATIKLFDNQVQIGQTVADAVTGAWSISVVNPLSDGQHPITATATTANGTSNFSMPTVLVIDTVAPTASGVVFSVNTGHINRISFGENFSTLFTPSRFTVNNLTNSMAIPSAQIAVSYDTPTNTATVTYPGATGGPANGLLVNGNYRFDFSATTDLAGNPLNVSGTRDFYVLHGDFIRNREVNINDFSILSFNFNLSPRLNNNGDVNYDGVVNINDFSVLASNFNTMLAPPPGPRAAGQSALSTSTVAGSAMPPPVRFADVRIDSDERFLTEMLA